MQQIHWIQLISNCPIIWTRKCSWISWHVYDGSIKMQFFLFSCSYSLRKIRKKCPYDDEKIKTLNLDGIFLRFLLYIFAIYLQTKCVYAKLGLCMQISPWTVWRLLWILRHVFRIFNMPKNLPRKTSKNIILKKITKS